MEGMPRAVDSSPYLEFSRDAWRERRAAWPQVLTEEEVAQLSGIGESLDLNEVAEIYLPISRLIHLRILARQQLTAATETFIGDTLHVPYIIGVAGSVAVGKSTTARVLREMLRRWPTTPHVELITTDGFLYPNAVLAERGLMARKGFPESYDRRALLRFMSDVKSGAEEVRAPVYSHVSYDIVPGEEQVVRRPDVLIVEGLNVLAPPRVRADGTAGLSVSDFFDFSVYVDARPDWIRRWYIERFMRLRSGAFQDPRSYFHRYAHLSDAEAQATAENIWDTINGPNLQQNVHPTRGRARLVLTKNERHEVTRVLLRKV